MRDLIQYRPNALVPLSGDSTSSVDPGVFLSSDGADDPWETSGLEDAEEALTEAANLISEAGGTSGLADDDDLEPANTESGAATPLERLAEEDEESAERVGSGEPKKDVAGKRGGKGSAKTGKEAARTAKANTSVPTQIPTRTTSKTGKANPIAAFADAAIAEEATRREEEITAQRELELKKTQYEYDMLQLKIRASLKRDTEERREKARKERREARLLDKKHEREFELEKLRLQAQLQANRSGPSAAYTFHPPSPIGYGAPNGLASSATGSPLPDGDLTLFASGSQFNTDSLNSLNYK